MECYCFSGVQWQQKMSWLIFQFRFWHLPVDVSRCLKSDATNRNRNVPVPCLCTSPNILRCIYMCNPAEGSNYTEKSQCMVNVLFQSIPRFKNIQDKAKYCYWLIWVVLTWLSVLCLCLQYIPVSCTAGRPLSISPRSCWTRWQTARRASWTTTPGASAWMACAR